MKGKSLITFFLIILACGGCVSPRVVTAWQPGTPEPDAYNRILVAAIPRDKSDTALRMILERQAVDYLSDRKVDAASSLELFGPDGFRLFAEEAAYVALCKKGIDAVLTFAEVDVSQSITHEKSFGKKSSSVYYYDHIWNYRKMYDSATPATMTGSSNLLWECILFDLNSLEPRAVLLMESRNGEDHKVAKDRLVKDIISKMIKEKIIKAKVRHEPQKAF